jgi:YYY domain-containing protein
MRLWQFDRWGLLWGLLIVLALDAAIVLWLGRTAEDHQRPNVRMFHHGLRALGGYLKANRRSILAAEALFLGGFAFMAAIRALNPDLWQPIYGGEKPFEFGFLNAILRSPVMPPYDPFFSDGKINYYYYGYFLVALPVKATGIPPAVAFNLIVPTLFAFTLCGAFAIAARLAGRLRYGLAGAALVALVGNLAAAFPAGLSRGLAPVRDSLELGLAGFGARLGDWFWGPSRVVYSEQLITINEFPFWSYLFADLHPHLIAMPVALLVIALAFELLDARRPTTDKRQVERAGWPLVVGRWSLVALALGALAVTNSWDFPTYTLLVGGALCGRVWLARRRAGRDLWRGVASALATAGGLALAALLLYLPFFQNYVRPEGVRGLGLVRDGLPLGGYLLIYGLFLAILAPWIVGVAARVVRGNHRPRRRVLEAPAEEPAESNAVLGIVARPRGAAGSWRIARHALWSALIVLALLLVVGLAQPRLGAALWSSALLLKLLLLALLAPCVLVLLARRLPRPAWFVALLAFAAWAVALGVEVVYIRDHLDGGSAYRMNTVFKFGLQSWILMALAAAAALPWLARGLRRAGPVAQGFGWAALAVLLALSLVFPLAGIPSRVANRFPQSPGPTLDGLAFMELAEFGAAPQDFGLPEGGPPIHISLSADLEAIRWLNDTIRGTPIVLQSDLYFYRAYGVRVAANTGLPTVVSPLHASEQHDPLEVYERDLDVRRIYQTTDLTEALRLLSKYHVGYVYVGAIERAAYGEAGVLKFDQMAGSYLSVAYQNGPVRIYKVNEAVYAFPFDAIDAPAPAAPPLAEQIEPIPVPPPDQATTEDLERRVELDPTAAGPAVELAQRYRELGRYDEAAAALKPAALAHPHDIALHHLLGDILGDAGRYDEAEAAYRAAIAADPSSGNYNKLGVELLEWGWFDKAAAALDQALAADANEAEPHFHLGQVYERQGQFDRAIDHYRAYLTIAPPDGLFRQDAQAALERLGT